MAAFLGTLLWHGVEPLSRLERILDSNWTLQDDLDNALVVDTNGPEIRVSLQPDETRMRRVVTKNAVGHLYLTRGVARNPSKVSFCALENLPDDAREALFGASSAWTIIQKGTYRFEVSDNGIFSVRSVIHEYLATETLWEGLD